MGPGTSRPSSFRPWRWCDPGRGDLPRPRLPDLCRDDRRGRGRGRAGAAPRGGRFSFDLAAFDASLSDRTRLIILNSPGNPTGGVMPASALEHIARAAVERDIWVLSDEIYSRLGSTACRCPPSPRCPAWQSGPSSATASPRPTR